MAPNESNSNATDGKNNAANNNNNNVDAANKNNALQRGDVIGQQSDSLAFLQGKDLQEEESEEDDDDFFGNLGPSKREKKENGKPSLMNRLETDPAQQLTDDLNELKMNGKDSEKKDDSITTGVKDSKQKKEARDSKFDEESELDRGVKNALITSDFRSAMNLSLNAGNIADALVFAYYGGSDLWEYAKKAYFTQHRQEFVATTFKFIANKTFDEMVVQSVE